MTNHNDQDRSAVMEFLLTRRSTPAKTLRLPAPERDELRQLLTAAARVPDHGALEPWRLIVFERAAMAGLTAEVDASCERLDLDAERRTKLHTTYANAPLVVIVVEVERPSEKFPVVEQTYSAGAVCLSLLNAALVSGWGANWLSGPISHERAFCDALGLAQNERIAGLIHIGTATSAPPERKRPDIDALTTWTEV